MIHIPKKDKVARESVMSGVAPVLGGQKKRILIICELDGFANSVRPNEIKKFLEPRGYEVRLLDMGSLIGKSGLSAYLRRFATYLSATNSILILSLYRWMQGVGNYHYLRKRAEELQAQIRTESPDAVICETFRDSYVLTKDLGCLKILDCPTPEVDEMWFGGYLNETYYRKLRDLEIETYRKADYLSFHWETYANHVRHNAHNGNNIFTMNWGCNPKTTRAKWASHPKVVFMGHLGYWSNPRLLARLSRQYEIDVFGGPAPNPDLGLNYKGYARTPDILADYQFGLVTISKDKLRQSGFSAKHLEYLSYGLPVLTPEWRKDPLLDSVSIKYNEANFLEKIREYSDREKWEAMSRECYQQSLNLRWERQLQPLLEILEKELK